MKLAFISGPYRAGTPYQIQQNIEAARAVALKYWKMGYAVICPHMNSALFDGECPDEVWLNGDLEILKRCDVIVMMKGWWNSNGAMEEERIATEFGLKIIYE